jgi:hypothetical protein
VVKLASVSPLFTNVASYCMFWNWHTHSFLQTHFNNMLPAWFQMLNKHKHLLAEPLIKKIGNHIKGPPQRKMLSLFWLNSCPSAEMLIQLHPSNTDIFTSPPSSMCTAHTVSGTAHTLRIVITPKSSWTNLAVMITSIPSSWLIDNQHNSWP